MEKLTHEEHSLRAALMKRYYDWRDGTYCRDDNVHGDPRDDEFLCCVTLEVIDMEEVTRRLDIRRSHMSSYDDDPELEPWDGDK